MGHLFYGYGTQPIELDDRILQYLQTIAATKLRRNESFTLTCISPDGGRRETIWLQPAIPLRFSFSDATPQTLETGYLLHLARAASATSGLTIDPRTWQVDEAAYRPALVRAA